MAKKFFLFIVFIRALAAILITNAHYVGVYPTDLIANGGLLGDVLFFAVSGFCLANTQISFGRWYARRIVRVYVPALIMTTIWVICGIYGAENVLGWLNLYIWPTSWHFVASIILLYIPLFFVSKYMEMNTKNYARLAGSIFLIQMILYLFVYDKTEYHIDNVHQPMIEFIFFQSMLLGLYFRWKNSNRKESNEKSNVLEVVLCLLLIPIYFGSKMLFVKFDSISYLQILNQVVLWGLLYLMFDIFMKSEAKFANCEQTKVWPVIKFIADHTLEIYLVQYVLIRNLKIGKIGNYASFPLNWLLLTTCIIICAVVLRWLSHQVIKRIKL